LEKNAQEGRSSDGFLVGAHLAAAFWLEQLPPDVTWGEAAAARHLNVVGWTVPRVPLTPEDIARIVAHTDGLAPDSEPRLLRLIRSAAP
jgi:hypothetical protein